MQKIEDDTPTVARKKSTVNEFDLYTYFTKEKIENDLNVLISRLNFKKAEVEGEDLKTAEPTSCDAVGDIDEEVQVGPTQSKQEEKDKGAGEAAQLLPLKDVEKDPLLNEKNPYLVDCSTKNLPKAQFVGVSKTPFKIRDNFSYLFGIKQVENASKQTEEQNTLPYEEVSEEVDVTGDTSTVLDDGSKNTLNENIPLSRLALLGSMQTSALMSQIRQQRSKNEYFFYYKWVLWLQSREEPDADRSTLKAERIVETNLDLKVASKFYKKKLQEKETVLIFIKLGIVPSKKSVALCDSSTIRFQVPVALAHDFLKLCLLIVMNDELNTPPDFQIPVCGVSHLRTESYSVISIWLHESPEPLSRAFNLTEKLKELIPEYLQSIISTGMLIGNKTMDTCPIYRTNSPVD